MCLQINKDISSKLEDYSKLFSDAEVQIKKTEILDKEIVIPAINQLRYAGYHIAQWIKNNKETEINKAINHCKRAYYDGKEVGLIFLLEKIQQFNDDFSKNPITMSVLPDYPKIIVRAQNAADSLENVKKNHYQTRYEIYKTCDQYYEELKNIIKELKVAEPIIVNQTQEKNRIEIKDTRRFIISTAISLIVILITILGIFISK